MKIKAGDDAFYFKGSETEIEFVSRNPIAPGSRSGIVYVKVHVSGKGDQDEKMSLMLYERDMIFMKEEDFGSDAAEYSLKLISGFQNLQFDYLKKAEDGSETSWQSTWDSSGDNKEMPLAVKMSLNGEQEDDVLCLVVPIRCREE